MSNRALAIIGFVIFNVLFYVQLDAIKGRIPNNFSMGCPQQSDSGVSSELNRLKVYTFMIYSELGYANELQSELLSKQQPDLAAEIGYKRFEHLASAMRSSQGALKFRPLRDVFKGDYEALKTRYVAENPDLKVPGE